MIACYILQLHSVGKDIIQRDLKIEHFLRDYEFRLIRYLSQNTDFKQKIQTLMVQSLDNAFIGLSFNRPPGRTKIEPFYGRSS